MKLLICIFFLLVNIANAQSNEKFFMDFLLEDELKSDNSLSTYQKFDFSDIWTQTSNDIIYGIIGAEHQRIRIKFLIVQKDSLKPNIYLVTGKSCVKETICDFSGTITLTEIKEVTELHFGVDDEYADKGIKTQGILIANYTFEENTDQIHSGTFEGQLYTKWYLNAENKIIYDDIKSVSDSYSNNAFIGTWKSNKTGKVKICNWADRRVPKANHDFDIGAGEFSVSEKYLDKGWMDISQNNQMPNDNLKVKNWWE